MMNGSKLARCPVRHSDAPDTCRGASFPHLAGRRARHRVQRLSSSPDPTMFPTLRLMEAISLPFKRSQLGLFHGKTKQYGNNVPFSKQKTRRTWLPNVHSKRLFSDTLQKFVQVKVTARALRTINKVRVAHACSYLCLAHGLAVAQHGGIDQYVLKTKPDLLGWEGMRIRTKVREKGPLGASAATATAKSQPISQR